MYHGYCFQLAALNFQKELINWEKNKKYAENGRLILDKKITMLALIPRFITKVCETVSLNA